MSHKFLVLALLVIACNAAPYPNETVPYSWAVQNFNSTCSAATCWAWGFSILGMVRPSGQPSFKASDCSTDSRIDGHQQCRNMDISAPGSVAAQIEGANFNGGLLTVQYTCQQ